METTIWQCAYMKAAISLDLFLRLRTRVDIRIIFCFDSLRCLGLDFLLVRRRTPCVTASRGSGTHVLLRLQFRSEQGIGIGIGIGLALLRRRRRAGRFGGLLAISLALNGGRGWRRRWHCGSRITVVVTIACRFLGGADAVLLRIDVKPLHDQLLDSSLCIVKSVIVPSRLPRSAL